MRARENPLPKKTRSRWGVSFLGGSPNGVGVPIGFLISKKKGCLCVFWVCSILAGFQASPSYTLVVPHYNKLGVLRGWPFRKPMQSHLGVSFFRIWTPQNSFGGSLLASSKKHKTKEGYLKRRQAHLEVPTFPVSILKKGTSSGT